MIYRLGKKKKQAKKMRKKGQRNRRKQNKTKQESVVPGFQSHKEDVTNDGKCC